MIRDAEYYKVHLEQLELAIAQGWTTVDTAEQLVKARDYCRRRIIECEYHEAVAVILNSN